MTENALRIIGKAMSALGLDYGFVTYRKKPVRYPYFVGEYNEVESMNEDGLQEISFMLTGFARGEGAWQALESAKRSIQNYFTRGGTGVSLRGRLGCRGDVCQRLSGSQRGCGTEKHPDQSINQRMECE